MHYSRMHFASKSLENDFPLTIQKYTDWPEEKIALSDQMIYRFSKLQDTIGNKLFKLILQRKAEDTEGLSFKDILLKLEKLHILDSSEKWLQLRETRNIVTHEYPDSIEEIVEGLNLLKKDVEVLGNIYLGLKKLKF